MLQNRLVRDRVPSLKKVRERRSPAFPPHYTTDVVVFWGFSNNTGESILNSLEADYLGEVYVQEERVTVV